MKPRANLLITLQPLQGPAEILMLLSLLALFVSRAFVPAWLSLRSDFPNYYIAARLLREHHPMHQLYDWTWFQRVKDLWSVPQPLVGFVGLTPFSALPVVPLTWLDAMSAKRIWLLITLVILGVSLYGMQRITSFAPRSVALIAFLAVVPLRNNFLLGQMHLLVLALLVAACWCYTGKRYMRSAIILAVAASLKIYPLFFVLYFLRKRQWKAAAVLAGAVLAITCACFPIFGAPVMRSFLIEQFPRMLRGEATDPFTITAPSASRLFHHIFLSQPQVNPHPLISSPLLFALLYPLWQLGLLATTLWVTSARNFETRRIHLEWAAWICLLLTLSTEPASYHRVALIFVAILALHAIQNSKLKAVLLVSYFAACNLHPSISPQRTSFAALLDYAPYWALLIVLSCLLLSLRQFSPSAPGSFVTRPRWIFAASLSAFVARMVGSRCRDFLSCAKLESLHFFR